MWKWIVFITIGYYAVNYLGEIEAQHAVEKKSTSETRKVIKDSNAELRKSLPVMIDGILLLYDTGINGKDVEYYLRYPNWQKHELDIELLYQRANRMQIDLACQTPEMNYFFDNGYSVVRHYYDMNGDAIFRIRITPRDCGR